MKMHACEGQVRVAYACDEKRHPRRAGLAPLLLAVTAVTALPLLVACGSSGGGGSGNGDNGSSGGTASSSGGNNNGSSSGSPSSSGGNNGSSSGTNSGSSSGSPPPPVACSGKSDGTASTLDFSNNLIASPAPPGNLTAQNAPQIVVFGWDDIESAEATAFLDTLLTGVTNPVGTSTPSCIVNPNACYGEGWSQTAEYACGNGDLATDRTSVLSGGCELGNHTFDHLESNSGWPGIPAQYLNAPVAPATTGVGWQFNPTTLLGPGVAMDQATWQMVIQANDTEVKNLYSPGTTTPITGFRAPRLEINDNGLNAIKAVNYQYDQDLEETQPDGFVAAAVAADTTVAKTGFGWFAWPYTLDNGSPGVWNQQVAGDPTQVGYYVSNFPTGLWEVPVYEVYLPPTDGLAVAKSMIAADGDCTLPDGTMPTSGCYLSAGEVPAGSSITEVTGFDFNLFIYDRMNAQQWTDSMQHTFLLHYYGDRAPVTYGAHPVEYTEPYDSYTLGSPGCNTASTCVYDSTNSMNCCQANNYGYRDVTTKYSTYTDRQNALKGFIQWIVTDPVLSKDTIFMSGSQLVQYMQKPFDKTGASVAADTVASPDSNGLFTLDWAAGMGATFSATSGNSATLTFNVASADDDPVYASASVAAGSLKNVSHIDIKYTSEIPLRIRLLTSDGSTITTTALLAGVGGDRLARIRIKDFFPGPEASQSDVTSFAGPVDSSYMAKVTGIQIESAATALTVGKTFNTTIEQITLHGVATSDLCGQ
jgi:hypothetical protein